MILNLILLFTLTLLAGLSVFIIPKLDIKRFKVILAFSGAYLFAITVIHLLPEVFLEGDNVTRIGIYVLAGFFLQMILEYFTSGVEHGHIHVHDEDRSVIPYSLLISLCIHSFLEGTLLAHPTHAHQHHDDVHPLLFGLVLHKIPEAFALMSVIVFRLGKKYFAIGLLLIFASASPLGLYVSNLLFTEEIFSGGFLRMLFSLVAGNFLYISTTIFFETSPNHQFKANKLIVSILGALTAVLAEYFL